MGFLSGAIGSMFGSKSQAGEIMEQNNQGFDYLKDNENVQQAQDFGSSAQGLLAGLLGLGGDQGAAEKAFDTFKDSSGYQFRMDEGLDAIQGSRAASGILNSGATSKELMRYGQNLASAELGNYMDVLGGTVSRGLTSAYQVGGTAAAAGAANAGVEANRQETQSSAFGGLVKTGLSLFGF